jgi:two-component system response regulator HydG
MNKKIRIAVVDDDVDLQELVQAFFRLKNYDVESFGDAELFLSWMEKAHEPFDVVITDLNLPGISGLDFTRRLKEFCPSLPVILITAYKSSDIAVQAIEAGAYDFIVKPIHFLQLQVSVERALYLNNLLKENERLKKADAITAPSALRGVIGSNPAFRRALELAVKVANSPANVLITGETGSGKEVIALAIHQASRRREAPFLAINCSAIPETLLESELFGHAKGAFTGANERRVGLFEEAADGTLFLDEIGDLKLPLQSKLLRVLQERKIKRLGENQFRTVNCRIISATHKDIKKEIQRSLFREDLYFRLNVIPIHIPPLRERKEDILPLAEFFIKKYSQIYRKPTKRLDKSLTSIFLENYWVGNVRELENTIERGVVLSEGSVFEESDFIFDSFESFKNEDSHTSASVEKFSFPINEDRHKLSTLEEITKKYILFALERNNGAKDKTAKDLAIDRKTLYRKVKELEEDGLPH